jgi:hypothetical protein
MHTIKVIGGGFVLLILCLVVGRLAGGPAHAAAVATAAKGFLPLWFVVAAINMWIGVTRAGYSVVDEAPVFAAVFSVPAVAALIVWWLVTSPR